MQHIEIPKKMRKKIVNEEVIYIGPQPTKIRSFYIRKIDEVFMKTVEEYWKLRRINKSDFIVDALKFYIANMPSSEKKAYTQATRNVLAEVKRSGS